MLDRLTDEQLVELVQEKPADELTLEETEQLRQRLRQSPHLQHILLAQLQMETYLHEALGEIHLSVDQILEQAAAQRHRGRSWPLAIGLAGLLVVALLAALWVRGDQLRQVFAIAENVLVAPDPGPGEQLAPKKQPAVEPAALDRDAPENMPEATVAGQPAPGLPVQEANAPAPMSEPAKPQPSIPEPAPRQPAPDWTTVVYQVPASLDQEGFSAEELKHWLQPVPGKPHAIHDEMRQNRHYSRLEGLGKLSPAWPEQGVLRLGIFSFEQLQIHFWVGDEGISLRMGPQQRPRMWYAYHATRKGAEPQPERLALLTTDNARHDRSQLGLFEIRYQDGTLVMSRGAVRLLTVPLAAPPTEIYFEGNCRFSHLSLQESGPLPPEPIDTRPNLLATTSPAQLAWNTRNEQESEAQESLVQPAQEKRADWTAMLADTVALRGASEGSVELTAGSTSTETFAYTRLPSGPRAYEVICCIEAAQPGVGVYLGDGEGKPLHRLGFFRDRRTGWTTFGYAKPQETHHEVDHDPQLHTAPYAGVRQWLRLVVGYRTIKLWTSGDGQHWGRVGREPTRHSSKPWTTVGLYALGGEAERQIRLCHLEVRPFQQLRTLADAALYEQVELPDDLASMSLETWLYWSITTRPAEVELSRWLWACALRTIEENRSQALSQALFWNLLRDATEHPAVAGQQRLKLLEEAALWGDFWANNDLAGKAFLRLYEQQLAQRTPHDQAERLETITTALLTLPIWTAAEIEPVPEHLANETLLRQVNQEDWEAVERTAQMIRFWRQSANPDERLQFAKQNERSTLAWAEMHLAQSRPVLTAHASRHLDSWRHPLLAQISKEAYNVMAEFESALVGEAWKEACQIITGTGTSGILGLLPDARDSRLLVSLPRAIALAMREHPPLRATMEQQFGRIGLLRVRQAINRADVDVIEAATVHFYGTPAAAEAHLWLGDRHLASGQFIQALQQYRLARTTADASLAEELTIRKRLAAAMLGEQTGEALQHAVEINGTRLDPQSFEALITDLVAAHGGTTTDAEAAQTQASEQRHVPAPQAFTVQPLAASDGEMGSGAGRGEFKGIDWSARQLAWTADHERFYLSNRFTVWARDLATGDVKWTQRLGGDQGEAHHWPNQPMRPLLVDTRIYVRRLTTQGPELACLQTSDGAVQWRTPKDLKVVADPVFTHGQLLALLMTQPQPGVLQIEVASFQSETGEVISREPLLRVRDRWDAQPPCQLTIVDNKLLGTVGGSIVCSDLLGRPQWLRRDVWLPREINTLWRTRYANPPLVAGERVFTAAPDVCSLSCLELDTGREHWMQVVPQLERLLAIVQGKVLVQVAGGIEAYDAHSGELLWRHPVEELLDATLVDAQYLLLTRRVRLEQETCPALVWLDVNHGERLGEFALHELKHAECELGPLIPGKDNWWALWGKSWNDPRKTLVRLTPGDGGLPSKWTLPELSAWTSFLEPKTNATTATVLPGWYALSSQQLDGRKGAELRSEFHGEKLVAETIATKTKPHRFARPVAIPASGATLRMRVGHASGQAWRLEVAADGELLDETEIRAETASNHWRTHEVDLTSLAGKTVWLSVSQTTVEKQDKSQAYWKRLEIILP